MKHTGLTSSLNNRIFLTIFISALLILLISPKPALGATVLSNYPPVNYAFITNFNTNIIKAVMFDVPAGSSYALNSFTAALSSETTSTYQANLYTTIGTSRDTFVASLGTVDVNTGAFNVSADITFTPSTPITLLAGQRYWIQLSTPVLGVRSVWSSSLPAVVPSGVFNYVGYRFSEDSGASWTTTGVLSIFTVDADIIAPTATPTDTPTNTPVTPTDTPTDTPTGTPVPPTDTPTHMPTSTPTSTPVTPTPTPTLPLCIYGLPPGGVQGRVLIDVMAFYNPSLEATTNILVQGGSSWWIIDARNGFYKLWISCEGQPIWVLANTVAPNFDNVWNGASLPNAGE